jgi:hypothetical protein
MLTGLQIRHASRHASCHASRRARGWIDDIRYLSSSLLDPEAMRGGQYLLRRDSLPTSSVSPDNPPGVLLNKMQLVEDTRKEAVGVRPKLGSKKRMLAEGSLGEREVLISHLEDDDTNALDPKDKALLLRSAREIGSNAEQLHRDSSLGDIASWEPSWDRSCRTNLDPRNSSKQELSQLETELRVLFATLERGLLDRGVEVRLLVLAALLQEHLLLLGPPGTAKSEVCRRLSRSFGGTYFERLLTRFTLPEELFGPLSLKLLQHDQYVRQTAGYLPEAEFAFLDEIFKSNSATLNCLLGIMNERTFHNGVVLEPTDEHGSTCRSERMDRGRSDCAMHAVPLRSMVAASNESPEDEELGALYDRFLLRRRVGSLSTEGREALIRGGWAAGDGGDGGGGGGGGGGGDGRGDIPAGRRLMIAMGRAANDTETLLAAVQMSEEAAVLMEDLLQWIDGEEDEQFGEGGYSDSGYGQDRERVSDRRVVKAVQMLKLVAWTRTRSTRESTGGRTGGSEPSMREGEIGKDGVFVNKADCWLLQHVFWSGKGGDHEEEELRRWLAARMCVAAVADPKSSASTVAQRSEDNKATKGSDGSGVGEGLATLAALHGLELELEDLFARVWSVLVEIERGREEQGVCPGMADGVSSPGGSKGGVTVGKGAVDVRNVALGRFGVGGTSGPVPGVQIGSSVSISGGKGGNVQSMVDNMAWTAGWDVMGPMAPLDLNHHLQHLEPAKHLIKEQERKQEEETERQKRAEGEQPVELQVASQGSKHDGLLSAAEMEFLRSCNEDAEAREGLQRRVMLWQKQEALNTNAGGSPHPLGDIQLGYVEEGDDEVNTARALADDVWAKRQKRVFDMAKTDAEKWHAEQQRWQQREWERAGMKAAMAALATADFISAGGSRGGVVDGDGRCDGACDGSPHRSITTYAQAVEVAERAASAAAREAAEKAAAMSATKAMGAAQQGFQHGTTGDKWRTPANLSKIRMHAAFAAHAAIEAKTELLRQRHRRSKEVGKYKECGSGHTSASGSLRSDKADGSAATQGFSNTFEAELYRGLYSELQTLEQTLERHMTALRESYDSDLRAVQSHPWLTPEETKYIEQAAAPTFAVHWSAAGQLADNVLTLRAALEYEQLAEGMSKAADVPSQAPQVHQRELQLRSLCTCMPALAIDHLDKLLGGDSGSRSSTDEKLQALHVMEGLGMLQERRSQPPIAGYTGEISMRDPSTLVRVDERAALPLPS